MGPVGVYRVQGASACQVPSVLRERTPVAAAAIRRAGCRVRLRRGAPQGDGPVRVVAQRVPADGIVAAGRTVTVTSARVATRCVYDTTWTTLVSDPDGMVAEQAPGALDDAEHPHTISACATADGQRWTVQRWADEGSGSYYGGHVSLATIAGPWAAYAFLDGGKGASAAAVVVADLHARVARRIVVGRTDAPPWRRPTSLAVNAAGTAAWTTTTADAAGTSPSPCDAVWVAPSGGTPREVATAGACGALAGVAVDGTTVSWTEAGAPRSAPLAP